MEPLLVADEVARRLSCSRRHVYGLTDAGCLAVIRIGVGTERRSMRWRAVDVEAFIAARLSKAGAS